MADTTYLVSAVRSKKERKSATKKKLLLAAFSFLPLDVRTCVMYIHMPSFRVRASRSFLPAFTRRPFPRERVVHFNYLLRIYIITTCQRNALVLILKISSIKYKHNMIQLMKNHVLKIQHVSLEDQRGNWI